MSDEKIVQRIRVGSRYYGRSADRPKWKAGEPLRADTAAFIATDGTIRQTGASSHDGYFLRVAVDVLAGQTMEMADDGVLSPAAPLLFE
jgi:hypothetical protein